MDLTAFRVDKSLPKPAYLQLQEKLERAIQQGVIPPGSVLPSERQVAESLRLSRMTVRRAIEALAKERYVEQRRGSGTYVLGRKVDQSVDKVLGFVEEATRLNLKPGSVLLEARCVPAGAAVARALTIGEHDTVLRISRLRTADDEPLAIQVAHLIPAYQDLSVDLLKTRGSLYQALREQFGVTPAAARQVISARQPTQRECELLALPESTPILALERTTLDAHRTPFEFVQSAYRSDRYRMLLELNA